MLANLLLPLALMLTAVPGPAEDAPLPRPRGLPKFVPSDAVIRRHSGHGDGGLLDVRWGRSSMLWAEPCRTKAAAEEYASGEERRLGCPAALDMQVRPLFQGALDEAATKAARKARSKKSCCYSFELRGNR